VPGREKSSQNVLSGSPIRPMATTAMAPFPLAKVVASGTLIERGESGPAAGVELEQAVRHPAIATMTRAPTADRALTRLTRE
jgi:hypothetical protein